MVTMMIVDDESIIREGLRDMIDWSSIGVTVVGLAADGAEGLELAGSLKPDIVLSDVIIPGVDGLTFCRRLHERQPDTRIVMISAYNETEYIRAAFKFDAVDYVLKPFNNEEMLRVVGKAAEQVAERRRRKAEAALMEEKIRYSLPAMRQQFFVNLVEGRAGGAEETVRQAELLGIDAPSGSRLCALQVWLDPEPGRDEGRAVAEFESALRGRLERCGGRLVWCGGGRGKFSVLLRLDPGDDGCGETAGEMRAALNGMGLHATIGIGLPVDALGDAGISHSQAETACNYRLLLGRNQVISYGDISQLAARDLPPRHRSMRDEVIDRVKAGSMSKAVDAIHGLFDDLRGGCEADEYYIRSVCIDLYAGIAGAVGRDAGDGSNIREFIQRLKPLKFIDDMEWLMEEAVTSFSQVQKLVSSGEACKAVRSIKAIVAERYMQRLTLSSLAREVYLTPTYVAALFKKETSRTLNDYITSVRIDRAKALLKGLDASIQGVAEAVGYQDVSYFTHLFKKHTGMTPSEYHRQSR